jgi:BASS family bile acid:Na+ symporter
MNPLPNPARRTVTIGAVIGLWTSLFPLWVVLVALLAYQVPGPFAALQPGIVPGLALIMLGMGMTLTPADFRRVATHPRAIAAGVAAQFLIMPLLAWLLARLFRLPPDLAMGLIIVGCCPGGTASNVVAYLARADVALSVTMTACSTLLAVGATPLLVWWLGGAYLPVAPGALLLDVAKIVLGPVLLGLGLRALLGARLRGLLAIFPAVSVLVIVLVIGAIVGLTQARLAAVLGVVGLVVALHNVLGMALGYGLAALLRLPPATRRTIAIEVGMQNSGLGVALASAHFGAAAALPGSVFSVLHNLSGAITAAWWRRRAA